MTDFHPNGHELHDTRILLISSDISDRHRVKEYLKSWGASVVLANSAARAFYELIAAADQETPFRVVIVDQGRLGMSSEVLARTIKSDAALQHCHLIHIGANVQEKMKKQLYLAGYSELLTSPLDKTLLFNALHRIDNPDPTCERVIRLVDRYHSKSNNQPLSILLAEKDAREKQRISRSLQQAGHQVFLVDNGARVLGALDNHRFDLAIVTFQLGEISGLDAFKLHRFAHPNRPSIPFVILLDEDADTMIQACLRAGIGAILTKPVAVDDLHKAIELSLQSRHRSMLDKDPGQGNTQSDRSRILEVNGLSLDRQRLQELADLGKGERFLNRLLENFERDTRATLEKLQLALETDDYSKFRDLGHVLKDSAGCLGALDLYQMGSRVTRIQAEDFAESAPGLLEQLEQCSKDSYHALQQYLTNHAKFIVYRE